MFDNEFGTKKNKKPKIKSTTIYNSYLSFNVKMIFTVFLFTHRMQSASLWVLIPTFVL